MSRADGRVRPGQHINTAFSARAWNRAQDAADIVLGSMDGLVEGAGPGTPRASNVIIILNNATTDVDRFGVLGVVGFVPIDPTSSEYAASSFAQRPVFEGRTPQLETLSRFAVCLEPIKRLSFGRAIVGGTFACKVRVNDVNHHYAVALPGSTTQLQSTTCGPVWLAWKDVSDWSESTRDDRWAGCVM